ncbi:JAB domain-containing protein [Seonamhaeicola sp.]|uniref:JAB domain-containing protein n=1 Tax=Seonamhaeicola sp. TaxID=1912245 RepID=UPI00260685C0|nr:JAB domain-containing protein [Seonamhaeicola sp.]
MKSKVNEIKISYKGHPKSPVTIKSSVEISKLLYEHWDKNTIGLFESFKIVLLNNSNKIKGICQLSIGGISGTLVDIRILFAIVLKSLSVAIILAHNHPSGKLQPSELDRQLTEKIKKAAELLDIKILDHVILAPNGEYYSFSDNGIL